MYTAFIQVSELKLWSLGDCNCLFCFGAAPLSKIAQLQSPWAHSFNQSLSLQYIFVSIVLVVCQNDIDSYVMII